jgi:hypothetical protein
MDETGDGPHVDEIPALRGPKRLLIRDNEVFAFAGEDLRESGEGLWSGGSGQSVPLKS